MKVKSHEECNIFKPFWLFWMVFRCFWHRHLRPYPRCLAVQLGTPFRMALATGGRAGGPWILKVWWDAWIENQFNGNLGLPSERILPKYGQEINWLPFQTKQLYKVPLRWDFHCFPKSSNWQDTWLTVAEELAFCVLVVRNHHGFGSKNHTSVHVPICRWCFGVLGCSARDIS